MTAGTTPDVVPARLLNACADNSVAGTAMRGSGGCVSANSTIDESGRFVQLATYSSSRIGSRWSTRYCGRPEESVIVVFLTSIPRL